VLALMRYGEALGMALQLIDDVLDSPVGGRLLARNWGMILLRAK
jgi:geranylgeranyl pyrophosphate synthase